MMHLHYIDYNTATFPFRALVESYLGTRNLEGLRQDDLPMAEAGKDQHSVYHRKIYDRIDETFLWFYRDFLKSIIVPALDWKEQVIVQKIPTVRFHLPGNKGVGAYHKDSQYNHSRNELNLFLPLTLAFGSNAIQVESQEDKGDFKPLEACYGECVAWYGSRLNHGNEVNQTGQTRVSFDMRIIRAADFKDEGKKTVSAGRSMSLGDYWVTL